MEPARVGLRPLGGLIGRSGDVARVLGHLDAARSVHLQAPRGAGTTALLRALCAEPARPSAPDGLLALPAGLPLPDLPAAAVRLLPDANRPVHTLRLLVLLDERDLEPQDLLRLQQLLPASLLVVTGSVGADPGGLVPVVLRGLSEHHAVGLVEAALGRSLSLEEGRAARWVASAVGGMPASLVQAAAAVRDGGLSLSEIRALLDEPPRPAALTVALQNALDDDLQRVLAALATFGEVPAPLPVLAAAAGSDTAGMEMPVRRLALLGLAESDGRAGWTAAAGVVGPPDTGRAEVAARLDSWLEQADPASLDLATVAAVLAVLGDRVAARDVDVAGRLAATASTTLPIDGLEQTWLLLHETLRWAAAAQPTLTGPDLASSGSEPEPPDEPAAAHHAEDDPLTRAGEPGVPDAAGTTGVAEDSAAPSVVDSASSRLAAALSDWRRLAVLAVAAAAVVAGVLLARPLLQPADPAAEPLRSEIILGTATVGATSGGTLQLDLSDRAAVLPVALALSGPDADAFVLEPARCDAADCRASITFVADRTGTHLATVTATDAAGVDHAVVELSGDGTEDPPTAPAETDLSVVLFPTEPSPLPAAGQGVLPVGVRNAGPDASGGVRLQVTLPSGVGASAPGCTFDAGTLTCTVTELAAGAEQTVRVALTLTGQEPVQVGARVTPTSDVDPNESDDAAGFTYPVGAPGA